MIQTAILIFLVAAVGGLYMAFRIFTDQKPPMLVSIIHGALAAAGLASLGYMWLNGYSSTPFLVGACVLLIAALGGFLLFAFHLKDKLHPKAIVVVHAIAAVTGVGALVVAVL